MPSSKPPTKEAGALLELERRMMAGDPAITPDVAAKIKAKLDAYRTQGLLPKSGGGGSSLTESQATASIFYKRAVNADKAFGGTVSAEKPRGIAAQTLAETFPRVANAKSSPDRQMSEQAKQNFIAASLRKESGAAISDPEYVRQDRIFFPQPGDGPEVIAQKAQARADEIEGLRIAAGPGALMSAPAAVPPTTNKQATPPAIVTPGASSPPAAPPSSGGTPALPPVDGNVLGAAVPDGTVTDLQGAFGGAPQGNAAFNPDQLAVSAGDTRSEVDPELDGLRHHIAGMVAAGASAQAIRDTLSSAGVDPTHVQGIDELVAFRKANPQYKGGYDIRIGVRDLPMSGMRSTLAGAAASPVGAYGITAADTILGGGLDEVAPGNTTLNRAGIDAVEAAHPTAAGFGTATGIAGNVATTMGGEGLLARGAARFAPKLGAFAAPVADAAYGITTGALSNNDDRLTGALTGGLAGFGGGVLGRTAGRIIAPSGGKLGALYDAGVRPTLGQRFVGTGLVGNAVNGVEEALQSVPLAGFAVRGARQKARDQFERGAFNSALGEIGQKLPDDVELGTAPHAFMQKAFSDAYDRVLPNMRAVDDDAFTSATQSIKDHVLNGGLSDDSASRFGKIIDAQVTRRFGDAGELSGDDLKAAVSSIGKQIQNLRSSPQGDRELASALEDYVGALKDSAMRNSDPGASAALDAVDRGYAKAVRVEDAASARGGDTGRFTPQQFDRYVQKDSGGIRSRSYLRGDALFGDYAQAGKSLTDRIPNSGTAERLMTTQALGGAPVMSALGYASPLSAGLVGAATLPYAPIARDVVGAALAPRQNQVVKTLGDYLRQRGGAPVAAVALPGAATISDYVLGQ